MLRWLTILFIVFMVILIAAPAGIGHVAAARQQFLVDELSRTVPGTTLVTESVQTGWLTSRLRHRMVVDDARMLELAAGLVGEPGRDQPLAIVIDSVVAHGPWPLLERAPGLARIRSTLSLPASGGTRVELPGEAITDIGFMGGGRTVLSFPEIRQPLPGGRGLASIDAVHATIDYDRSLSRMRSQIEVARAELVSPQGAIEAEDIELAGDTRRSTDRLWVGESTLSLGHFLLTDPLGETSRADGLRLKVATRSGDGLLEHRVRIDIDALTTPLSATNAIVLDAHAGRLDSAALGTLVGRAQDDSRTALEPGVLSDLVRAGPFLEIQRLVVSGDRGDLQLTLALEVPETEAADVRDASDLLSVLEGAGRLSIDAGLLTHILGDLDDDPDQAADPNGLVSQGILSAEDDRFTADLRIDGGLITINGLPLPISR